MYQNRRIMLDLNQSPMLPVTGTGTQILIQPNSSRMSTRPRLLAPSVHAGLLRAPQTRAREKTRGRKSKKCLCARNVDLAGNCCGLHIKPFFLPNDIGSTLSVLPDSSSQRDTNSVVTDCETEKNQTPKNQGRQIKCQRTGYESTTKNATREIRATKKKYQTNK